MRSVTFAAFVHGKPVGIGSYQPVGDVTEIVGVAVLPPGCRSGNASVRNGRRCSPGAAVRRIQGLHAPAGGPDRPRLRPAPGANRPAAAGARSRTPGSRGTRGRGGWSAAHGTHGRPAFTPRGVGACLKTRLSAPGAWNLRRNWSDSANVSRLPVSSSPTRHGRTRIPTSSASRLSRHSPRSTTSRP
jgi:hypothetical protein